jgi:hypothetical protein
MFLVRFVNFGYTKPFPTKESAIKYMEHSGLETTLTDTNGLVLGDFSPIDGEFIPTKLTTYVL